MALAKKGTRVITVDGERYRWTVAPDDEPGSAIVVESETGAGQRMVTWVEHGTVIAPGIVAWTIRAALARGWTPGHPGRQRTFRVLDRDGATLVSWPGA